MSFKVTKLTVGKGKTTSNEEQDEWNKLYFEVEALIEDERQIEMAKSSLEALLDMWLKGESVVQPQEQVPVSKYDMNKIKWTLAEGASGPYERSEDVDSLVFKELLKDLEAHNGKLSRDGYFVWKFAKSPIVGRKKKA